MSENTEKILFKCKHCENDDMKYFVFHSLEFQSDQFKNSPYRQNWNRETTPKIPIGFHVRCAKCNKDTFFVPNEYNPTPWGSDIPQQCLVNVKFEKPAFSAISYVLTEDGYLDQIVLTANNERLSMLSKTIVDSSAKLSIIGKPQYDLLLSRGLKEVGYVEPQQQVQQIIQEENVQQNISNKNNNNNKNNKN
ncbi:MAG: hypothetical protein ACRC1T_09280 [Clostridium chrysemydis]|uniref:hypothetical protein n=1 Tax=Clostridium chrysemydis TaxID=2665504 RepID=UPI003F398533